MTEPRGPGAALVDRWQQSLKDLQMGSDGLFQVELHCVRCGRVLNADGNHPAEVHAGTCNGLCYGCTAAGPYIEKVYVLDGALRWNYPPHCPSWRRDREHFTGYPGCPECRGTGVQGRGTSVGGGSYRQYCRPCLARFSEHPLRAMAWRYQTMVRERSQAAYTATLLSLAGAPKRCSAKRKKELISGLSEEVRKAAAAPILERCGRLLARHQDRVDRLQVNVTRPPTPEEQKAALAA